MNTNLSNEEPPTASEDLETPELLSGEEEKLAAALEEAARYRDTALRAQADFDNFRKRAAREKEDAIKYANSSLLERLIPIVDNFELGLVAARTDSNATAILSGMEMVLKQIQDFLADSGVQAIDAVGQPFDPHLHEALAQEPSAEHPEGTVTRQIRKGYRLRERLIRPANVIVSSGPNNPEETDTDTK